MPTSLEACRLWMLAIGLAAIPIALAFELLWQSMPAVSWHRGHRVSTMGSLRSLFALVAAALAAYVVLALVSSTL